MKSIKISESVYQKLKKLSTDNKLTMNETVEKLLSTVPPQNGGGSGGNEDQKIDTTGYRIPVENGSGKVEYVTREELDRVVERVCRWSEELLESLKKLGIDLTKEGQNATKQNC